MKNSFIAIAVLFLLVITACNTTPKTDSNLASTDSLMMQWNNAWNASDGDKVAALFTNDAIFVGGSVIKGIDSIRVKFIQRSIGGLKNLATEKIHESVSADYVSQTGSYTHDWVKSDSTVETASGFYTFIWQKQSDKTWKLVLIQM